MIAGGYIAYHPQSVRIRRTADRFADSAPYMPAGVVAAMLVGAAGASERDEEFRVVHPEGEVGQVGVAISDHDQERAVEVQVLIHRY